MDPAALRQSRIYRETRVDNARVLERLLAQSQGQPAVPHWLAVVPGSSEAKGHHTAWPPTGNDLVEPEFQCRLAHARQLLTEGVVGYVLVSGGSVDARVPEYNEGLQGRAQLLRWDPALQDRIIVDPYAIHTVSNVRNGDRVAVLLALDHDVVVTTAGFGKQGWWLCPPFELGGFSFDATCGMQLGYGLGDFAVLDERTIAPPFSTVALIHTNLANDQLLNDERWE